jgi:hypothetical protein
MAIVGSLDQLSTAAAVFIRRNMIRISRAMNRGIEHFQKPRHEPLTASDHVQSALALMFFQGFL